MKLIRKTMILISITVISALMLSGCSSSTATTEDLSKTITDSFTSIRLEADVAAVDIIPEADIFAIEYHVINQSVTYSVKNGTLTLTAKGSDKTGVNSTERSYITIYVPDGSEFSAIDCKCSVGDIHIGQIKVDHLSVDVNVGNVTLSDVGISEKLNVKTNVGNIDVDLHNTNCSYDVSVDIGAAVINGTEFSGVSIKKEHSSEEDPQVTLSANTGNISLHY